MPSKKSVPNQVLGQAIRSARKQRGWPQERFAARANIDRSYYGAIERGEFNITMDTIMKIAAGLEMTASDLLGQAKL